jgi:hypothetical protein
VEGQVSDVSTSNPAVQQIFIHVMANFAMKIRHSTILLVNLIVRGFIKLKAKPVRQHVQAKNLVNRADHKEKQAADLSLGNGAEDIQLQQNPVMLYDATKIVSIPDAHVMAFHFST